jgi:hypothetical protein|tara:strand:- start:408 stop:671 length:264 start_codon:yes stop_codon:yes gene_type:complete
MDNYEQNRLSIQLTKAQKNIDLAISCMSTNQDGDEHPWDEDEKMHGAVSERDPHEHPPCGWCRQMMEDAFTQLHEIMEQLKPRLEIK